MLRKPSPFIAVFLVPQVVLVKQVCNLQLSVPLCVCVCVFWALTPDIYKLDIVIFMQVFCELLISLLAFFTKS